jgi:hypothetical protein
VPVPLIYKLDITIAKWPKQNSWVVLTHKSITENMSRECVHSQLGRFAVSNIKKCSPWSKAHGPTHMSCGTLREILSDWRKPYLTKDTFSSLWIELNAICLIQKNVKCL